MASICGLGSTGLILEVTLDVEPAFRLREVQETYAFDDAVRNMDRLVHASEHVRFWWFPQAGVIRASSSNRTDEVRLTGSRSRRRLSAQAGAGANVLHHHLSQTIHHDLCI